MAAKFQELAQTDAVHRAQQHFTARPSAWLARRNATY